MSPSAPRSALGSARPLEPPEAAAGAAPVEPPPEPPSLHHCTDALLADLARAVSRGVGGGALQWGAGLLAGVVAGTAAWALAGSLRVGAVAAGVLAGGVGVWTALLCLEWLVSGRGGVW